MIEPSLGIIITPSEVASIRALNAVSIFLPLAGTIAGVALLPATLPGTSTWVVFAALMLLQIAGVTMGLHRYFTHRSFRCGRSLHFLLLVLGSWAFQGPVTRWVADHRRHHRFSDQAHDPHSPYWSGATPTKSRLSGWAHAHLLWMLNGYPSDEVRYAPDCLRDPLTRWATKQYWAIASSGLLLPGVIGALLGGAHEALLCFLWAGCARVNLMHQLTWSVNSFGHMFGPREPGAIDQARNNPLLAIALLGEGLHSFHHMHGTAAVNGSGRGDPIGWVILVLAKFGIVTGVRRAPAPTKAG